ncbi:MAG: hypothetical protein B7Z66_12475 [Chromatiales bacterium 21-64-14]|nr:MAG: hypothetical protein B7Z66_12475 [Chromatiales bacterium 21-64-14]HQU16991.1 helix-turn-helix transcriptional regulator [Gammaproteobacteria bacterium]
MHANHRPFSARQRLARRVRLLRIARGWSQEVLAELSGLHRTYIGSVERAERNISLDNIEKIARALETPIPALVDETEPTPLRGVPTRGIEECQARYGAWPGTP